MGLYRLIALAAALLCLSFPSHAQTTNYTYDALGRLVEVERVGTGKTKTYVYDDAGNRQSVIQTSDFGTFSVGGAIVTEGGVLSFTITKTGGGVYPHDVAYSTSHGSAGTGDYTPKSGAVTFDVNDVAKTVTVNTTQDSTFENDETLTLTLTSASNGGVIAGSTGVGTIVDDDNAPAFSIGNAMETEGADLVFTVTKAQSTALTHDVSYATADNSATAPSDYGAISGTLSFAPGETTKTITVPGAQDSAVEGDETFYVNLSSPSNGALLADDQGVGTIYDNDVLSGDDIRLRLIDPATSASIRVLSLSDTISASELSTGDYSLRADYLGSGSSGSVLFIEDGVLAHTENGAPYMRFGDGQGAPLPGGAFTLKIEVWSGSNGGGTLLDEKTYSLNVSSAAPTLAINNQTVAEDAGPAVFTVTLTGSSSGAVTVDYATADNTAQSGSDYTATSGTLTFTPGGAATQTISVPVADDAVVESAESFHVNLTNAAGGNATITDSQGVGTINDNDVAPGDITLTLVDPATNASLRALSSSDTISASELSTSDYGLLVDYTGSGSVGSVRFFENGALARNENAAPYSRFGDYGVGGSILGGPLPGGVFTLKIEVWSGSNGGGTLLDEKTYTLGVSSAAPILAINNQNVAEDAGAAVFTVTLTGSSSSAITVDYATADYTAQSGSDYTAASGTLTFTPGGAATQAISVPITDDTAVEGTESFHVNLTNAAGGGVAVTDSQGVGTITDNDFAPSDIILTLVDPATNASLRALSLSDTISASELSTGDYGLLVDYTGSGGIGSVRFFENGVLAQTENGAPYSRFGDYGVGGSILGGPLPTSAFTVKVEVWSGGSGTGTLLAEATYSLGVN